MKRKKEREIDLFLFREPKSKVACIRRNEEREENIYANIHESGIKQNKIRKRFFDSLQTELDNGCALGQLSAFRFFNRLYRVYSRLYRVI